MTLSEIQNIKDAVGLPVEITEVSNIGHHISINDYVALRIVGINNSYDSCNPIDITLQGISQGTIIFTKNEQIEIASMTEFEFLSFLTESDNKDDYDLESYEYKYDYLLIKSNFLNEYLEKYGETSALWGGFSHALNQESPTTRYKKVITKLEIGNELKAFDSYSYESCTRAVEQPYAFERFLKLYHLLELQFDYFLIEKIKNLEIPEDSNKIGKLLQEYSHSELIRLTAIIEHHCTDIARLERMLEGVCGFKSIAEDMFINFGKSEKKLHLIDVINFRDVLNGGSFTSTQIASFRMNWYKPTEHIKFIIGLTSYWIYRIRCSIAHNKIGEYLLSWNDENFIVEFGEPLLKEVLMQCFKK